MGSGKKPKKYVYSKNVLFQRSSSRNPSRFKQCHFLLNLCVCGGNCFLSLISRVFLNKENVIIEIEIETEMAFGF